MLIISSRSQLKGSYFAIEKERMGSNSAKCCIALIGDASVTRTERGDRNREELYMGWHEKARLSHKPAESGVASILRAPDAPRLWVRTKMHPKAEMLADLGIAIAVDHLFRSTLLKLRYSRGDHAV